MANDCKRKPRENFRRNLAELIDSNKDIGGNLTTLSRLSDMTVQGLRSILKGTRTPGFNTLISLANALGITVSQLIGELPLEAKFTDQKGAKNVPILLWQQAHEAKHKAPSKTLGNWDDWALTNIPLSASAYALRIESKNLEPHFHYDDILIIDPEVEPADNDYVIVQSKNCEKARIKKIVNDGNLWLHSLVADHPPIELGQKQNKYVICGVGLQKLTMFRDK